MLVGLVMGSVTTFAAKDSTFHFSNSVRVGYDDNVYLARDSNQQETTYITDIAQISGKMVFSSRSDLLLFWQPEFRYRLDADPKFVSYQDLYGKLSHAMSQRVFLTLSDRLRFQEKDGQSDLGQSENQNFLENDLKGALDFTLTSLSQIKVGAGYEFRQWMDDAYGKGQGNNYDQYAADGSYVRELRPNTTHASVGLNYLNNTFEGSRGGFDSTTAYGGVDHNFNANLLGTLQLGYSFGSVDAAGSDSDTSNPFLQSGLEYNPSDRTSLNASLGYALSRSQNSTYNASEDLKFSLGIRQELTGKISLSSVLSYTLSSYDASYNNGNTTISGGAEENYLNFTLRGSYQINRNNFVDIGYGFAQRGQEKGGLSEYTRSQFDFGWRLKL